MKLKLSATIALLLIVTILSCHRETQEPDSAILLEKLANPKAALDLEQGKLYYRSLIKKEGKIVQTTGTSTSSNKDKVSGKVNQRIITFVPDVNSLGKYSKDVKTNRIGKLDPGFSGWLIYSKWDGTKLFALRILNGKPKESFKFKGKKNIKDVATVLFS